MNHRGTETRRRRFWILDSGCWIANRTTRRTPNPNPGVHKSNLAFALCLCVSVVFLFAHSASAQREAQLSWWDRSPESKYGHYWIKSDLPPEELRKIAQHLNLMYGQYSKLLAFVPVRIEEKLNVLAFRTRQDFQLTLQARFGVKVANTGGLFFVMPGGSALAFWTEGLPGQRLRHVVQHEGFHQFAYSRFGDDLPPWVNEGLAEFCGEAVILGDKMVIGQANPRVLNRLKQAIDGGTSIPLSRMLSMNTRDWADALRSGAPGGASLQYAEAWSMVQFLIYGENGAHASAFDTYLKHVNTGLPASEAFVRALGTDINDFEARWKRWALAAQPNAFVSAMENLEFLAEGALELHRCDIRPASLEELRQALSDMNFEYTLMTHGMEVTLKATDAAVWTIPKDALCREQPVFAVEPVKPGGLLLRERKQEEANPSPPTIRTENVQPRNLAVRWIRDKQEPSKFTYEIVLR